MKYIIFLFILTTQLFSQTYFDVYYSNGDPMSSTPLSSISKITFSGTDVTFHLTDNSTNTKALSILSSGKFSSTDGGNPLPVELSSFIALLSGSEVILQWTTAIEVNNYGFEVQKKLNLRGLANLEGFQNWEKIGFVEGHGNSNSQKKYSFIDNSELSGTIQYRLKQIDTDGLFEYSDIVEIELNESVPSKFSLEQNYPNPFNPETMIKYSLPVSGFVTIKVYDILGNEIATIINEKKEAGIYNSIFNGSNLSSGIYFCRISFLNSNKSIKMMLIK